MAGSTRRLAAIAAALFLAGVHLPAGADVSLDPASRLIEAGISPSAELSRSPALPPPVTDGPRHAQVRIDVVKGENPQEDRTVFTFNRPMRIGIQTVAQRFNNQELVEKTRRELAEVFGSQNVEFYILNLSDLRQAVREDLLDFVISNAYFFSLAQSTKEVEAVASLWSMRAADPALSVGSTYIARADNEDVQTPEDMQGKKIGAYYPSSFAGYSIAVRDFVQRGVPAEALVSKMRFYGENPAKVIEAVREGYEDAAILPACVLEYMAARDKSAVEGIRVLGERDRGLLECRHSTELYPGLYFSSAKGTDPQLKKAVTAALFTMSAVGDGTEWSLPVPNRAVYDLFFDLKEGPYEYLTHKTIDVFLREQSPVLVVIILVTIAAFVYMVSLSLLVRIRTRQLREALEDRNRIERLANASRDHIANLERTGIVGQMSTMIAHELKQPLGAITNFANGLLRRVKRGNIDEKVFAEALAEIVDQGTRASEIVNRVRSYAKRQSPELKFADMSGAVERAIEIFRRSRRTDAPINKLVPPYLWAEIDAWEIELAVLNLLKNAADALVGTQDAVIRVAVYTEDKYWRIAVKDNGAHLQQADVDEFMMPLVTSKPEGLGLGLSIVANIVERHHGRFVGLANADRGCTICMDIPRADERSGREKARLEQTGESA